MNEILTKMKLMRLQGMAKAFTLTLESGKNEKFTPDEMVTHLVESEWDERYNRKLDRTVQAARFRYKASIEQIDYEDNRMDKNQVLRLADCEFIKRSENIIMFVDELHTIVGAGGAEGAIDASNILKPALARGEIR